MSADQLSLVFGEAEEWRAVAGYEGLYDVSSFGRVRSLDRVVACQRNGRPATRRHRGKMLRCPLLGNYCRVSLSRRNIVENASVHVLVCLAFHGPKPKGWLCAHWDRDVTNNRADNLRWATYSENNGDDRRRHGTLLIGEDHPRAKLRTAQAREIFLASGTHATIGARYGVSGDTVGDIKRRCTWRHVTDSL